MNLVSQTLADLPRPAYGFGRRLAKAFGEIAYFASSVLAAVALVALIMGLLHPNTSYGERMALAAEGIVLDVLIAAFLIGAFIMLRAAWRGAVQAYDYLWHGLPVTPRWQRTWVQSD